MAIRRNKLILITTVFSLLIASSAYVSIKIFEYKAYIWLPKYLYDAKKIDHQNLKERHVIFMIADHHEPGPGERGVKISNEWCRKYKQNVVGLTDDYNNLVQYTWFYPYDHHNPPVLINLNGLVFDGLGEIEFHWHHGNDTNSTFPLKLKKAVDWFSLYGCFQHEGMSSKPQFGFIHGNWALDNSLNMPSRCGVNRELDILREYGCYADFTFSTLGTFAQPTKINSIYYTKDTDEPKSYNTGNDVEVGHPRSDFMIFEGPMAIDWHDHVFEDAAIENTSPFKPHRVMIWLNNASTVKGRPEWLFIKVFTHGAQSRRTICSSQFRDMCTTIKDICHKEGLKLHYVTAREAYNIVKAAEMGYSGNPEQYRNLVIKKPINSDIKVSTAMKNIFVNEKQIDFDLIQPQYTSISFKIGPVKSITGWFSSYRLRKEKKGYEIFVQGKGQITLISDQELFSKNKIIKKIKDNYGQLIYYINAEHVKEPLAFRG